MTLSSSGSDDLQRTAAWRSQALIAASAILFGTVTVGGSFFHQSGFSLYEIALSLGARALVRHSALDARAIAEQAMTIAAGICIYTNTELALEEL